MIGAIAGDTIESVYETRPIKKKDFPLFHSQCRFSEYFCHHQWGTTFTRN
jgi:hypothetical protein